MSKIDRQLKIETLALHGGQEPDPSKEKEHETRL